ncbi:MAG TPA: tetratricopeptide repeat protein [Terriglobales bacterium]|nr:tetratricopeptide repeat protein [Terriglobales bacterium]
MFLALLLLLPLLGQTANPGTPPAKPATAQAATPTSAAPSDPAAAFAQAQALIDHGKFDEGIAQLRQLQARDPKMKGLNREFGVAYYKHSDFMSAAQYLQPALQEDPNDGEAAQLLGLAYYFSGKPAQAVPLLEKVNSWYPSANVDASYVLGICYIQLRQYDQARKAFATMYGVQPDSAPAYLFAARMLLREEFDPIAEQYAKQAIAIDPRLPLAHYFLGELYLYKSRIPESIEQFQRELALDPAHAPTYYKLADAYTRVLKWDDAERLLQRSIWLDSTASGPYILMGKVLLNKGEPQLAVRTLKHALQMDPNNYIAHHLLGESYRALGDAQQAAAELKFAGQLQSKQ